MAELILMQVPRRFGFFFILPHASRLKIQATDGARVRAVADCAGYGRVMTELANTALCESKEEDNNR